MSDLISVRVLKAKQSCTASVANVTCRAGMLLILLVSAGCVDLGKPAEPVDPGGNGPGIAVSDVAALEGAILAFRITTPASSEELAIEWVVSDSSATAGADFQFATGEAIVPSGETETTVSISSIDDALLEGREECYLRILGAGGITISDAVGVGTIWDNDGVRYQSEIRPLLQNNCAFSGCHGDGSSEGGIGLADAAYTRIVQESGDNGPFIVPGNGGGSNFYRVTTPASIPGVNRMPDGGPYLTTGNQQLIKDWIDQGAQDN